jgi:hypothetical protein
LDINPLEAEFRAALSRLLFWEESQANIEQIMTEVKSLRAGVLPLSETKLVNRLNQLQINLRQKITETLPGTHEADVLAFRQALERRWGIETKLEALHESAAELGSAVRARSELWTNQMIGLLTIFGFPIVFLASFFEFVLDRDFPGGIHVVGILWYTALSLVGILGIFLLLKIVLRANSEGPVTRL